MKNVMRLLFATTTLLLLSNFCDAKTRLHRRYKRHSKLLKSSRYRGDLPTLPASYIDGFPLEICDFDLNQKLGYEIEVLRLFAVVSKERFKGSHPCGSKIKVSCVEPFDDLGGPTNVCQTKEPFILTVISSAMEEDLGDDLMLLPSKIFSKLADPGKQEFIRVAIHPIK